MGDLMGHLFPGILFSIAGLWWLLHMFPNYYRSRCRNHPSYRSQPWYSNSLCCNFPVEGVVKVVVTTIGIVGETVTALKMYGPFPEMPNAQHMTMYFFFAVNGAMDILSYYNFQCLPLGIEVATGILAFGVEGFLFYNHLHGRPPVDVSCHMFIFYTIVAIILCIFLEIKYREFAMPSLARAYFTLLQGTWFFQVGFILYPPSDDMKWDLNSHEEMMTLALIFAWHVAVDFLVVIFLAGLIWSYMKRCRQLDDIMYKRVNEVTMLPPSNRINGNVMHVDNAEQLLESDSEGV